MVETRPATFTFIHAAHLHLDTPFREIHAVEPLVGEALREASLQAFDAIIQLAIDEQAAFVVFAGDIYDGAERGLRAQLRFREGLGRLSDQGIASFVVHGNHDPVTTGWSAIHDWPERTTVFGCEQVVVVPVLRDGRQIATVQGISYATPAETENLALRFSRPPSEGVHVGLLHCNVAGVAPEYTNYSPCTVDQLRETRLDYLALGHIHQRQIVATGSGPGDPWIVYPGNSQSRSPKSSEQEPKGATVVRVVDGAIVATDFAACDRIRFGQFDCVIDEIEDLGMLTDRLQELSGEELQRCDGRSLVVRARLCGKGALHHDLVRPGVCEELLNTLRDDARGRTPFVWWDEIKDATQPLVDLDALRGRGDFTSDLLELTESIADNDEVINELAQFVVGGVPRSMTTRLDAIVGDRVRLDELLAQALGVALDELAETP